MFLLTVGVRQWDRGSGRRRKVSRTDKGGGRSRHNDSGEGVRSTNDSRRVSWEKP